MLQNRRTRSNRITPKKLRKIQSKSNEVDLLSDLGVRKLKAVLIEPKIRFPNEDVTQKISRNTPQQTSGNNYQEIVKPKYSLRRKETARKVYKTRSADCSHEDNEGGRRALRPNRREVKYDEYIEESDDDEEEDFLESDQGFINDEEDEDDNDTVDDDEDDDEDIYHEMKLNKAKSKSRIKKESKTKSNHSSRLHSKREISKTRTLKLLEKVLKTYKSNDSQRSTFARLKEKAIESSRRRLRPIKFGFVYKNAMDIEEIESESEVEIEEQSKKGRLISANVYSKQDESNDDDDSDVYTDTGIDALVDQASENECDSSLEFAQEILDMATQLLAMNDESEDDQIKDQVENKNTKAGKRGRLVRPIKQETSYFIPKHGSIDSDDEMEDVDGEEEEENRHLKPRRYLRNPIRQDTKYSSDQEVTSKDDTQGGDDTIGETSKNMADADMREISESLFNEDDEELNWTKPLCKRQKRLRTILLEEEEEEEEILEPSNEKVSPQHSSDEESIESDRKYLNKENILNERTRGKQVSHYRGALSKLKNRRDRGNSDSPDPHSRRSVITITDESDTEDVKYDSIDEDDFVVGDNIIDGVRMTENEEYISELNREQIPGSTCKRRRSSDGRLTLSFLAEFSRDRLKSWTSQYKTYIEYLVYQILCGSKSQKTASEYDVAKNAIERRINGYKDSISTSDAWLPEFKAAMDKYPVWVNNDSYPSSSFLCEACRNHPNNESRHITLYSDDREEKEEFYLGTQCHGKGHMYHYLTHFEFHMRRMVKKVITEKKYSTKFSDTQTLRPAVDRIYRKLLTSGFIKESYNDFKNHMTELAQGYCLSRNRLFLEDYLEDETSF
ncbi:hypothetical protein K501DRAFT_265303 [Backusella circina FSU 941]|nr:hypothetical protein K501DRAFT_265303 [Backusella circina FSU 941]